MAAKLQLSPPFNLAFALFGTCLLFLTGCNASPAPVATNTAQPTAVLTDEASSSPATIEIRFQEGAPKDRFVIHNQSACDISTLVLTLDLSESAGKLIFDTTAAGAGVEVFQPFEVAKGDIRLTDGTTVTDGDNTLALTITALHATEMASFTIDVDDTLTDSDLGQIRVAGSEISGGVVTIATDNALATSGTFDENSVANVQLQPCS